MLTYKEIYFSHYIGINIRKFILFNYYSKAGYYGPIINLEPLKDSKTIIFAPHYSSLDFVIIDESLRKNNYKLPFYIVKASLPYLLEYLGAIRVYRKEELTEILKNKKLSKEEIENFKENLRNKIIKALELRNLVIFPEGKRSNELLPLRQGTFRILSDLEKEINLNYYFIGFDRDYKRVQGFYLDKVNKKTLEKLILKYKTFY
ncbi:MAG: 1-acyl-sn-glycerol-3-phosphate acyltransferase [Nanoarchaeota archaeon]